MLRHSLPLFIALLCCSSSAIAQEGKPARRLPERSCRRRCATRRSWSCRNATRSATRSPLPSAGPCRRNRWPRSPIIRWPAGSSTRNSSATSTSFPRRARKRSLRSTRARRSKARSANSGSPRSRVARIGRRSAARGRRRSRMARCAAPNSKHARRPGNTDAQWTADAQAMWRSTGKALPRRATRRSPCLASKGGLPASLRWERIERPRRTHGSRRSCAAPRAACPLADMALANDYAAFFEAVHERALTWPKTPRSRLMASQGLARLAKSAPMLVDTQLPKFASALGFTEADRGSVRCTRPRCGRWRPTNPIPRAASTPCPKARTTSACTNGACAKRCRAATGARRSPPSARWATSSASDSRWTYFEARLTEIAGDKAGAQSLYREAARKPEFHGFLAADRIGQPYALCPGQRHARHGAAGGDRARSRHRSRDGAVPGSIARAGRNANGTRRCRASTTRSGAWPWQSRRTTAGSTARCSLAACGKQPEETRLYDLRFPLHHDATIRREAAKNGLDPAWVAAEIRAESVFNPNARSGANAMGLMQVAARAPARPRPSASACRGAARDSLYDPDTNIASAPPTCASCTTSTARPTWSIAGYNAGPGADSRAGRRSGPAMDPDFWIETISYKETREYVARVLAFSVIYDWRLNGDAAPVSDRMRGRARHAQVLRLPRRRSRRRS